MPRKRRSRPATRTRTRRKTRYLFVFGGVLSGVGKGTAVASIGRILLSKGYRVTAMKIDPYLNVDAGTMNPIEHGEVFVTDDGLESDQDLGNYERFLDQDMGRINYMTSGQVYLTVIQQERNLAYGGKCVETVPHIPEEVTKRIHRLSTLAKADFVLIEVGGTVGEYQNLVFLEAARMMKLKEPDAVQFLMVSYLPIPSKIGEMKTKPTQHAVQRLNSAGIQPDYLLCRAATPIDQRRREKLSIFCNVQPQNVISAPDVDFIYEVPVNLNREHLGDKILAGYGLVPRQKDLREWTAFVAKVRRLQKTVRLAIVGKYFASGSFTFADSYISVIEAIKHAAWSAGRTPLIEWVNAETIASSSEARERLKEFDGVIVPGGFGLRGIDGKIDAIRFVRENAIPFLGLCFGMQLAVIEYANNVLGLHGASSVELHPKTKHPVIDLMEAQKKNLREHRYGGSMRLGAFRCRLTPGSRSATAYGARTVSERHRHRYELNNRYRDRLEAAGMKVAGVNPELDLVEIIELPEHPFFVGVQFHPEFLSRPLRPHPLFAAFLKAAVARSAAR